MTSTEPRLVWPVGALLGEGPVWLRHEGALRFVDIKGGCLHRLGPGESNYETLKVGGQPSFIVPTTESGLLVGDRNALRLLKGKALGPPVVEIAMPAHNRTNDATVDPQGRLWFGTMDDDEHEATGSIFCLDRSHLRPTETRAVVTNGPAVSGDGRYLYWADSGERTIWRHSLPESDKPLGKGEVFVRLREDEGFPDGLVTDSEDCLWVALWDGWGVRRYAPDGRLLEHVALPCARVTKLAFGGEDLKTAYVTTARVGLSDADLATQPLAGSLFSFPAPTPGRILPAVRLTP